jgi:hypothetical protein
MDQRNKQDEKKKPHTGNRLFLFSKISKTADAHLAASSTRTGDSLQGVKWTKRKVDHSPSSNAEVKNEWSYICTPSTCLHGMDNELRLYLAVRKRTNFGSTAPTVDN